jgi:hypothetical protein
MRKLKEAIARKSKQLLADVAELPETIPIRPPGYFHGCYDRNAAKESKRLAAQSIQKIVK